MTLSLYLPDVRWTHISCLNWSLDFFSPQNYLICLFYAQSTYVSTLAGPYKHCHRKYVITTTQFGQNPCVWCLPVIKNVNQTLWIIGQYFVKTTPPKQSHSEIKKNILRILMDGWIIERQMVLSSIVTFSAPCITCDLGTNDSFIKLSNLLDSWLTPPPPDTRSHIPPSPFNPGFPISGFQLSL